MSIVQPQVDEPPTWFLAFMNANVMGPINSIKTIQRSIDTMSGDIRILNEKLDVLNGRVDEQKIKIDQLADDVTITNEKIDGLEQRMEQESAQVREDFTTLGTDIITLKQNAENTISRDDIHELKVELVQGLTAVVVDEISKRLGDESHQVPLENVSGHSESNSEDSVLAVHPSDMTPFHYAKNPGIRAGVPSMDEQRARNQRRLSLPDGKTKNIYEVDKTPAPARGKPDKGVGGGVQSAVAAEAGTPPMPALIPSERVPPDPPRSPLQPVSERVASVVVAVKPVEELLTEVTLRTLARLLYEVYVTYLRTSVDKTYSLVDHVSRRVIEELVGDQRRKNYPCGSTVAMDNIFEIGDDATVRRMLVEYVRPQSRNDFEKKLYGAISPLPQPTEGRDFTLDYDRRMASKVDKVLHEVEMYIRLLREDATPDQMRCMPEMNWGKGEDNRGVIQMAMYCLRPYVPNFKAMIIGNASETGGMKRLIECNTVAQWVEIIQKVNDLYSNQAMLMRRLEMQSKPMEKAEVVQSKVEEQRMQKNFVNGKAEKLGQEARRRSSPAGDLGRVEGWYLNDWGEYEPYREERLVRQAPAEPRHPPAELRRIINWEEPRYPRGPPQVRNFERLDGGHGYGEMSQGGRGRGGGRDMAMRGGAGRGRLGTVPPPGRGRGQGPRRGWSSPPAPPRPPKGFNENPLVCFKFAMGTCDKGKDCEYAHDPALARKYLAKKVAYYSSSKWFDPSVRAEDPSAAQNFGITEDEWYELQRDDEEFEDEQAVEPDYGYDDGGAGSFVEDHEAHWRS